VDLYEEREEVSEREYALREIARRLSLIESEPDMRVPLSPEEMRVLSQAIRSAQRVCDRLIAIRTNHKEAA
jgi:hypothetical protein